MLESHTDDREPAKSERLNHRVAHSPKAFGFWRSRMSDRTKGWGDMPSPAYDDLNRAKNRRGVISSEYRIVFDRQKNPGVDRGFTFVRENLCKFELRYLDLVRLTSFASRFPESQ